MAWFSHWIMVLKKTERSWLIYVVAKENYQNVRGALRPHRD